MSDKTGLIDLARALARQGTTLLSTGGTSRTLRDAGFAVVDVSDYTGSAEILDGRVKTLHPKIHGVRPQITVCSHLDVIIVQERCWGFAGDEFVSI